MKKERSKTVKIAKHVRRGPGSRLEVVREYTRTLATLRRNKAEPNKDAGHDDLPDVEIVSPAVKPKGIKSEQIRRAVHKAVREFSERHGKALARS